MRRILAFFALVLSVSLLMLCVAYAPVIILAAMITGVLWMFWVIAGDIVAYLEHQERRSSNDKT